jgi:hypothetical protein
VCGAGARETTGGVTLVPTRLRPPAIPIATLPVCVAEPPVVRRYSVPEGHAASGLLDQTQAMKSVSGGSTPSSRMRALT